MKSTDLRILLLKPREVGAVSADGPAQFDGRDGLRVWRPHLSYKVAESFCHVAFEGQWIVAIKLEQVAVRVEVLREDLCVGHALNSRIPVDVFYSKFFVRKKIRHY